MTRTRRAGGRAPRLLALLAAAALPARADDVLAVMAVADPPGPEPELSEMTHQLRAACRDRTGGVQEVPEMRQRLLGQSSSATLAELERAYGGALATYQNGEYQSSIRTLYAIVDDLEKLPEGPEAWSQWVRAQLRLAHAEGTVGHVKEEREAMERLLAVEPRHQPDPDQYSPTYRRDFEAARARVAARSRRRLTVDALGWSATVYVNGRASGTAPVTLSLPPGRYRIGGSAGTLRVPSVWVVLRDEDRTLSLDFGLAEALRVSAGPGLALPAAQRTGAIVRAGAWLGADRLLVTSIAAEGEAQFLVGSLHDIRRGALQREGRVRMAAGGVPIANLGALAAFLLTGQQSRVVMVARAAPPAPPVPAALAQPAEPRPAPDPLPADPPPAEPARAASAAPPARAAAGGEAVPGRAVPAAALLPAPPSAAAPPPSAAPPQPAAPAAASPAPVPPAAVAPPPAPLTAEESPPGRPAPWLRPAMWGTGAAALGLLGAAGWQALAARGRDRDASAMLRADGSLQPGIDPASYDAARVAASGARRNAWVALAGAAAFAAAAGTFGWLSLDAAGGPAVRF